MDPVFNFIPLSAPDLPLSQRLFEVSSSTNKTLHIFAIGKHGAIKDEADFDSVFSAFLEKISQ